MRVFPLLVALGSNFAFADEQPPIATDRPGFSDGSNVVAPGVLQFEGGFFRTQVGSNVTSSFGDGLFRFGLSKRYELRLLGVAFGAFQGVEQWLEPSLGFKARIIQNAKAEVTFIGQTTVPIGQGALRSNRWNPTYKVAATGPVGNYTLGSNLVFAQFGAGADRFDQSALTLFLSRAISAKTTLTSEVWGVNRIQSGGSGAAFTSLAVAHLLDNNRQLDLRVGTGFSSHRDCWFIQGGFSVRF